MTRKKRFFLFLGLAIIFLIVAPLTVLYCLGWRFDWETKTIIQPGIFYFKVWPKNVEVYINDKFKKKTDVFFGSILIDNLKPGEYKVEIKKEGYLPWQKNLEIKKRQATEAKNIFLVPENPEFNLMAGGIKNLFFSPDGKQIILKEDSENGWALKLFETEKKVKSRLISENDISKEKTELIELKFSSDSKRLLLKLGLKEKISYYVLKIEKSPPELTLLDFLRSEQEMFLYLENKEIPLFPKNISAFGVSDENIFYLTDSGFLFKEKEKLNLIPFEIKQETKYQIIVSESAILLQENNVLYIFDEEEKSFKKIYEPAEKIKFSPNSKKIAYTGSYEIWVLFLEKNIDMPSKEKGEKLFITRFSEKLGDIFWYTSHYLIFNAGNKIKVAEIDNRDKINIVDLAEFPNPEIFWTNKKLYILSEENLYVSEELIP